MSMAHKRKDILWKSAVDEFVVDMLRFFYPNADQLFDFSQPIEFLDPELAQLFPDRENMKDSSILDRLIRIHCLDGSTACIYLLLEIHDYNNKAIDYDKRIFLCFARLFDKYEEGIMPLVVYTGSNKTFKPGKFGYSLYDTRMHFEYGVYRVVDQEEELLKRSTNLFSIFIRTVMLSMKRRKIKDEVLIDLHVALAKEAAELELPPDKFNELLKFIKLYIDFGADEINRTLEERIDSITVKTETMNLYEAEVIIKAEEAAEAAAERTELKNKTAFVRKLLQENVFTAEKIADLAEVPLDFVFKVKEQL